MWIPRPGFNSCRVPNTTWCVDLEQLNFTIASVASCDLCDFIFGKTRFLYRFSILFYTFNFLKIFSKNHSISFTLFFLWSFFLWNFFFQTEHIIFLLVNFKYSHQTSNSNLLLYWKTESFQTIFTFLCHFQTNWYKSNFTVSFYFSVFN